MTFGSYYHGSSWGSGRDAQDQIARLERERRDLQSQVDDYRQREQERQDRERREYEERRREAKERAEEAQYHADGWPEAFSKQLPRLERELAETVKFNRELAESPDREWASQFPPEDTSFWERQIEACKQGQAFYRAAQEKYAGKRQELLQQLDALEQEMLNEVAAQVRALHPNHPSDLAECLEVNDPDKYLYW